ncbi:hypothetical protein RvY_13567-2 [Ramazzottius varieornatus]|uniref:Uncharacterized protein n=1 Tax=Ramazzottius varieornatus TaxID=947166 RepID=A0A1D1VNB5_RAMVA|nr:hypothetical protein RvY_13567-2 [Ramazzottius varieornatus]
MSVNMKGRATSAAKLILSKHPTGHLQILWRFGCRLAPASGNKGPPIILMTDAATTRKTTAVDKRIPPMQRTGLHRILPTYGCPSSRTKKTLSLLFYIRSSDSGVDFVKQVRRLAWNLQDMS